MCVCVCVWVLAVQQADCLSVGLDGFVSLAYLTHSIPVRAPQIKIAAQLGHNVQSLALIRTLCVCVCVCVCVYRFQKQLPLPKHMTGEWRAGWEVKEEEER